MFTIITYYLKSTLNILLYKCNFIYFFKSKEELKFYNIVDMYLYKILNLLFI